MLDCAAAKLARNFPEFPTAATIEAMMLSTGNFDDAAILTVRTPVLPIVRKKDWRARIRLPNG
jgi:hypothetical protein